MFNRIATGLIVLIGLWGCQPAEAPKAQDTSTPTEKPAPVVTTEAGSSSAPEAPAEKATPEPAKPGTPKNLFTRDLFTFDQSKLKSEGEMDPATFKRIIGKRKSSLKVCYKKALSVDGSFKGDITLRFSISPTGRVGSVNVVEDTLGYPPTTDCLVRVVRKIRFPEKKGGQRVTVEYPFQFVP